MLRSVQKGRVNQVIVYLVGIELDKPRDTGSTKDGYFLGYQVLDCAPGTGFVCEEVRAAAFPSLSPSLLIILTGFSSEIAARED